MLYWRRHCTFRAYCAKPGPELSEDDFLKLYRAYRCVLTQIVTTESDIKCALHMQRKTHRYIQSLPLISTIQYFISTFVNVAQT